MKKPRLLSVHMTEYLSYEKSLYFINVNLVTFVFKELHFLLNFISDNYKQEVIKSAMMPATSKYINMLVCVCGVLMRQTS